MEMTENIEVLIKELKIAQEQLKAMKAVEMRLRKAVASLFADFDELTESTTVEDVVGGMLVIVKFNESLKVTDPDALVDLVLSDALTADEKIALKLKPDITLARLRKLDDEYSEIWESCQVEMSPTPTVEITDLEV